MGLEVAVGALDAEPLPVGKIPPGFRWFWCAEAGAFILAPSWFEARAHAQRVVGVFFSLEKSSDPAATPAWSGATVWVASGCDAGGRSLFLRRRV